MKKLALPILAVAFFLISGGSVHAQATCVTSFDCAAGQSCLGGVCSSPSGGSSGTCTTDANCAIGQSCLGGTCTSSASGGTCTTSANCAAGQSCLGGTCTTATVSGSCQSTADCTYLGSGYTCQLGSCVSSTGTTGSTGATGAGGINTSYLSGYEQSIVSVINNILVPLLVAVAFIIFLWGVFNYFIRGAAEPEKRKEGAQFVLYGIIGFVIIFAVWGLVNLLLGTLSLTAGGTAPAPPTL